jgi:hypothetical protein
VTDNDPELEPVYLLAEVTEARAAEVAMQHITAYAPFVSATEEIDERSISAFERLAATRAVGKTEMTELLGRDIRRFVRSLRSKTVIYPQMGSVRLAVLAHVAMVIGQRALMECRPLWDAISGSRWDDASDALLLTRWPEKAKVEEERRRVLELARMMRTGSQPIAWTH